MGFWDDKKPPKEDFSTKDDIKRLEKDIEEIKKQTKPVQTQGATGRLVKAVGRGMGDLASSLNSPENKKRMRIAQMVDGKHNPMRTTKVSNPIAGREAGMKRHRISNAPKRED